MEIVRELKLQRDVVIHNNILRLYGITKDESENNYLLVMDGIVHRDLHSRNILVHQNTIKLRKIIYRMLG
ncbi:unnamed protein product [Rhizophagus irregularis]|nr:unnamed protein product [Rhizophagus irregularis]